MAKANRKSRFAVNIIFKLLNLNPKFKRMFAKYLDYKDVIYRTKQINKVLLQIKQRKKIEKTVLNVHKFNIQCTKKKFDADKQNKQIQYGFNIAKWWNELHE